MFSLFLVFTSAFAVSALIIRAPNSLDVHLAVSPGCGSFSGAPADVNAGLRPLNTYKTIVSFGVCFLIA